MFMVTKTKEFKEKHNIFTTANTEPEPMLIQVAVQQLLIDARLHATQFFTTYSSNSGVNWFFSSEREIDVCEFFLIKVADIFLRNLFGMRHFANMWKIFCFWVRCRYNTVKHPIHAWLRYLVSFVRISYALRSA